MSNELQIKYKPNVDDLIEAFSQENTKIVEKLEILNDNLKALAEASSINKKLVPSDINLSYVPNWPPASKTKAVKGTDYSSFLSPKRLDDYMDSNVYVPLTDLFNAATLRITD